MKDFTPSIRRNPFYRERQDGSHGRLIEPTPFRLPKNEQVAALLTMLMKAEKHDVIKFDYDQSRCCAVVFRARFSNRRIRWELRARKAYKLFGKGSKNRFHRANNLDDILDLLDS